jgi:signal transduction histidine kinase/CheY-like chemotaxis protein
LLISVEDVTAPVALHETRRQLEDVSEELEDLRSDLEVERCVHSDSRRLHGRFLARISHDLRTPLSAVLGSGDLLVRGQNDKAEIEEAGRVIRSGGDRLIGVLDDALDMARLLVGELEADEVQFSPIEAMQRALELAHTEAVDRELSLEFLSTSRLPASARGDGNRLGRVVTGVVLHALRSTSKGGVRVWTGVEEEDGQDWLRVEVSDTGRGLSEVQVARLLTIDTLDDASARRFLDRHGVGLYASLRLATVLGGRLAIDSQVGQGTTYRLWLPIAGITDVPLVPIPGPDSQAEAEPLPSLVGLRVLVVDDTPVSRRVTERILLSAGAEVICCCDGREAIEEFESAVDADHPFDLVLLDMEMPVLDGYVATQKLRSLGYSQPVIALTANTDRADRERCMTAGCDGFLGKPVRREVLVREVARFCRGEVQPSK